jgi:hypothetical protein
VAIVRYRFNTPIEADAFMRGIEYVNDSSVTVVDHLSEPGSAFPEVVILNDNDADEDRDVFVD